MAASEQVRVEEYAENDVIYLESEESDPDYDSDYEPSGSILEQTQANFSHISIGKKSTSRTGKNLDEDVNENGEEILQNIVEAGQLEKLKVEQCKVYLRKNGLRLAGNKCTLIQRVKEHLDILNGEGEKKYPVSSFILNCKGDACTGDVVMFEQNVYKMFNLASRSGSGPPCGKRIVAGRIVKESYGEAKQQHTFTIEVLWSKGDKPLPPLHPLLIKGRNLYRMKTLRQRWEDEDERIKVLMEKHSRGSLARSNRRKRIEEKERKKMLKENSVSTENDPKRKQLQLNLTTTSRVQIVSQRPAAPQNPIKFNGVGEFQPLWYGNIVYAERTNHIQPNFNSDRVIWLSEKTNHREPLMSINNFHPMSLPRKQGSERKKLCRYHAQGRCYFGDNCKFLHDQKCSSLLSFFTCEAMTKHNSRFTGCLSGKMANEPVNVNDFQELARLALPKMYYDFYSGGAEDQHTLKENIEAFRRITLRPRILVDVSRVDLSTTILGYKISAPIIIAPTAIHKMAHPEGEIATARAAAACNTIMVLSYSSSCTIEEVAASCNAVRFYQLYVYKQRNIATTLVQRAERNGYKALVLTADTPRLGRREADIKNKMIVPPLKNLEGLLTTKIVSDTGSKLEAFANETMDASLSWKDIRWLRSITKLPILIKGILTCEDAIKAVEAGVAGIIVSNHGARQLDYSPATISVLEEVVHAVEGKIPVLMDGGIRRGTDIFKALALGAQAVLVGRPVIYGLAAGGDYGVRKVLQMLKDEFELTMALSGCPSVKHITRKHVRTEHDRLHSML